MKRASLRVWFFSAALAFSCGFVSFVARAESPAEQEARANALFKEALAAFAAGDYATACPKYEEVVKIKPGLGARIGLGDCYRKMGRLSRAWEVYRAIVDDAPEIAKQAKTWADGSKAQKRGEEAKKRLEEIEPHLGWIKLSVAEGAAKQPSFVVHLDGAVVTSDRFGARLPADRGEHLIDASATGKKAFDKSVAVAEGAELTVTVAPLDDEAPPLDKPKTGGDEPLGSKLPVGPRDGGDSSKGGGDAGVGPRPEGSPDRTLPTTPSDKFFSTQRILGLGLGLAGVGAGVAGAVFGFQAIDKRDASEVGGHCVGNVCDEVGLPLRQESFDAGRRSTGFLIGGGIAFAAGVALFVTAPRAPRGAKASLPLETTISIGPSAIVLRGRF